MNASAATPPRSVLVTGASSGFGARTAQALARRGHTVFATMRDIEGRNAAAARDARAAAAGAPGTLCTLELDVTKDASVAAAAARTGRVDAVVNNAGISGGGLAEAFTVEQFQRILDVNVLGVQRVTRAFLPAMRAAGSGLLVFVSSIMGRTVIPFAAPYTASKFALEGLAESYRYELAGSGVDVAILEPGAFLTRIGENIVPAADEARAAAYGPAAALPDRMWTSVMEALQGPDASDPELVASAVVALVERPAERRPPLRTVIDPLMGGADAKAINATASSAQAALLAALGLTDLE